MAQHYHGPGSRMVRRSHTAMASRTVLVGEVMEDLQRMIVMIVMIVMIMMIVMTHLLRTVMMRELETMVTSMRLGITHPYTGCTISSGPSHVLAFTM